MSGTIEFLSYEAAIARLRTLQEELYQANVRAAETEQFLNYASDDEVREHRNRVAMATRSTSWDGHHVPMPYIEGNRSVWHPPAHLLSYDQAYRLPVGSVVCWSGDRRTSGRRIRTPEGWFPILGPGQYYWLEETPAG